MANLLENPGFETDTSNPPSKWANFNSPANVTRSAVNTASYSGSNCWKVETTDASTADCGIDQNESSGRTGVISITPGTTYRISGYIKTALTTGQAHIHLKLFQSGYAGESGVDTDTVTGTTDWNLNTTTFTPGAGYIIAEVWLCFGAWGAAANGTAYFDNIILEAVPAVTAISNLTENFNDNSLDTDKWDSFRFTGGTVSETNNRIELGVAANTEDSESGIISRLPYNLTGGRVTFQPKALSSGDVFPDVGIQLEQQILSTSDQNYALFGLPAGGTGDLTAIQKVGGTFSSLGTVTYNSTTHKYLGISESNGTLYWEYSADYGSWSPMFSEANPFAITSSYVLLDNYEFSGTTTPSAFAVDNINLQEASGISGRRSLLGVGL